MATYERTKKASKVASEIGYSPRHLTKLAREGLVPAIKRGTMWMFSAEELKKHFGLIVDTEE